MNEIWAVKPGVTVAADRWSTGQVHCQIVMPGANLDLDRIEAERLWTALSWALDKDKDGKRS